MPTIDEKTETEEEDMEHESPDSLKSSEDESGSVSGSDDDDNSSGTLGLALAFYVHRLEPGCVCYSNKLDMLEVFTSHNLYHQWLRTQDRSPPTCLFVPC